MFVIVNVAIYIAPAHNARCLDSVCSSSRSETDVWRNSHDSLTNGDPTLSITHRDDAGPMPSPGIQWMYPILVCLRSLVFRRVLERYTHVYMSIPDMYTSRYTNCRALLPPRRMYTPAKHFADESSFAGDTVTDSLRKDVPTKRGVVSAVSSARLPTKSNARRLVRRRPDSIVQRRRRSASTPALVPMTVSRAA